MSQSHFYNSNTPTFNVYLGDTDCTGDYKNDNTLVYNGPQEGVAVFKSITKDRYIIWELTNAQSVRFSTLRAYDLMDIGHHAKVTASGLSSY